MIGWMAGRQERRKPIRADFLNDTAQQTSAQSRLKAGPGMAQANFFGTPVLRALVAAIGIAPAKSPGGGIAGRSGSSVSSGTCTLYAWDGSAFTLGSATVAARNWYTGAIAGNVMVILVRWGNSYWVLTADCEGG